MKMAGLAAWLCLATVGCEPDERCDPGQILVQDSICVPLPSPDAAAPSPDGGTGSNDGGAPDGGAEHGRTQP